jgi:phosphatidate cytidylyltransferase
MLKQRVLTAVVLLVLLSAILFAVSFQGFAVAVAVLLALAAWEWSALSGLVPVLLRVLYALFLGGAAMALSQQDLLHASWFIPALALAVLLWLPALLLLWQFPQKTGWNRPAILLMAGLWLLLPVAAGLLVLQPQAANSGLIVLVVLSIAVADIGAYFCGKRFGKRKLALQVSPGKTWEGLWGGMVANLAFAGVVGALLSLTGAQWLALACALLLTAAASVLGDLFESMIKRQRGVKDSGHLLPGHGGVLDRIDGWTAAVPLFALLYLLYLQWGAV